MAIHGNPTSPRRLANPTEARPKDRDAATGTAPFLADVLMGLRKPRKELPCKYFYDAVGSSLFDDICETDEYYPTRTELAIMRCHAGDMGAELGPNCQVIEYGSGSSVKTRWLLRKLPRPAVYVPVDISAEHLHKSASALAARFPEIDIHPVAADFTQPFELPASSVPISRRVVYFPGSTIGNFAPPDALRLLGDISSLCGAGGALLIGVDLKKDIAILDAAYNDASGVTAAFNKNLLTRINRELGADFDLNHFRHQAHYNPDYGRMEMHLISTHEQCVHIAGNVIPFHKSETIHTENSHKYTISEFQTLAARANLRPVKVWTDAAKLFSVQLYNVGE